MRNKKIKGFSLIELIVVIGIIALLVSFSIPAINTLQKSFGSTGAEGMIDAALSTARTLAISNSQYAGIRFQKVDSKNVLRANQYMIFITRDRNSNDPNSFRIVEGYKPIRLPVNTGIMDLIDISSVSDDVSLLDITTFSIVFSPDGKLIVHDVQLGNEGDDRFLQDTLPETSRRNLVIYNREIFNGINPPEWYSKYLKNLKPIYINVYTGTIVR